MSNAKVKKQKDFLRNYKNKENTLLQTEGWMDGLADICSSHRLIALVVVKPGLYNIPESISIVF